MKIGRIYKIISAQGNECYVGSTFNTLRDRFKCHKQDYNKLLAGKKGKRQGWVSAYTLFDKYKFENCKIVLIKEYEVCDRRHLEAYEQLWINKLKPINKNSILDIKRIYRINYYKKHKEKIRDNGKKYREENKEIISERRKTYRDKNKETIKSQRKQFWDKNKDRINEARTLKIVCECGSEVRKSDIKRHQRTKKHLTHISS